MDLENRVSRRLWALPTASRCCQAGNLWVSVFKDRTATLGMLEFHRKKNEERGVSPSSLDKTSETMSAGSIQLPTPVSSRHVFTKHKGMLRTSDAIRLGLHLRTLYNLRDRGELEQVARGIYRLSTAPPLTSPDLVSVAIRIRTTTAFEFDKPSGFACSTSRRWPEGLLGRPSGDVAKS